MDRAVSESAAVPWQDRVGFWSHADLAVPSPDHRQVFSCAVLGPGEVAGATATEAVLQVTALDGCRPGTALDTRWSGLGHLQAPVAGGGRQRGGASKPAGGGLVPKPISALLVPGTDEEEDGMFLLLLSTGLLLSIHPTYLGIEAVLGVFPDVNPAHGPGAALALLREQGWALVAEGSHLGMALADVNQIDYGGGAVGAGSTRPRSFDLPKGSLATSLGVVQTGADPIVVVGCSGSGGGRVLLYGASMGYKKQTAALSLTLVQSLDLSLGTSSRGVRSFFRGSTARASQLDLSVTGESAVADTFTLVGDDDTPGLMAAGCSNGGAGLLVLWQLDVSLAREATSARKGAAPPCRVLAHSRCRVPVLRVVLLAPSRAGSVAHVLLALEGTGDVSLWHVLGQGQLAPLCSVPGRGALSPAAARTFSLAGSLYLLAGWEAIEGRKQARGGLLVAWLDVASLLYDAADLHPPLGDASAATCLGPPLSADAAPGAGPAVVANGGEVFFISESRLQCHRCSTGRTAEVRMAQAAGTESRVLAILDALVPDPKVSPSHLLLAVAATGGSGTPPQSGVWLVSTEGDIVHRIPSAFDAVFLGHRSPREARVAWLARTPGGDNSVSVHVAPAFSGNVGGAVAMPTLGVDRIIGGCPSQQHLLYWGHHASGAATLQASTGPAVDTTGLRPSGPLVALPPCGPPQLVAARWDRLHHAGACLALVAPQAIWVVAFHSSGVAGGQHAPRASLVAWLDLRTTLGSAGRPLSAAWLRPAPVDAPAADSFGGASEPPGVLLVSLPWGVVHWPVQQGEVPKELVLCERPQLLAGALLDRLLCVEVQRVASIFAGMDRTPAAPGTLPTGSRSRLRARPLNLLAAAAAVFGDAGEASREQALAPVRDSDWRLLAARLPSGLPPQVLRSLWPVASTSDAPPQLLHAAPTVRRLAGAAEDEFRGLAAVLGLLQSHSGRGARRGGSGSAGAAWQVEEAVLRLRSDPAGTEFLQALASLLCACAAKASHGRSRQRGDADSSGLALTSRSLAKHDLLPLGPLVAGVLRGSPHGGQRGWRGLFFTPTAEDSAEVDHQVPTWHWTQALRAPAPLAVELLARSMDPPALPVRSRSRGSSSAPGLDFSAVALVSQRFSEPPSTRRLAQAVQPSGEFVCHLHTATLLQWLGLGSTQLQVRMLHSILQEGEAPGHSSGARGAAAQSLAAGPPTILANGVLVYWRCADGEGPVVRDSGGCCRFGRLHGPFEWRGPLPAEDPMEVVDEWGSNLSPNFALALGPNSELSYTPAEGSAGAEDRKMLSLVGGPRADGAGLQLLRQARAAANAGDDDDEPDRPGWTVECWARLTGQAAPEGVLFSRRVGGSPPLSAPLAWTYRQQGGGAAAGFEVRSGGRVLAAGGGAADEDGVGLYPGAWTHVALRSDLSSIDVWAGRKVVARAAGSLPHVPLEAGLFFGSPGVELTEVRVWGVWRSDAELREQQAQPLPTVLSEERKVLKVRLRARGAEPDAGADGPGFAAGGSGFFGLNQLVAPPSRAAARRRQGGGEAIAARAEPTFAEEEAAGDPWGGGNADPWGEDLGGGADAWDSGAAWDAIRPSAAAPAADPPFGWPEAADSAWPDVGAAPLPPPTPPPPSASPQAPSVASRRSSTTGASPPQSPMPAPAAVAPMVPPASSPASSQARRIAPRVPVAGAHHRPSTTTSAEKCSVCGMVLMAGMGFCRRCGAKRPAPSPSTSSSMPTPERSSRELPAPPPAARREERPPPNEAPSLEQVLPAPLHRGEEAAVTRADYQIFAATHALENRSYGLACSNYREALRTMVRHLPPRPASKPPSISPPVRARIEAAAAYAALSLLLQRCEELRQAAALEGREGHRLGHMSSGHYGQADEDVLRKLCATWACVLRIAKAPKHTVHFAVRGMAAFFTWARPVGGWDAAQQVASALLGRCREMLTESELDQVEYVAQATAVGRVARGAPAAGSTAACGACPRCTRPVEPLAPTCGHCFAALAVCFRDLRLCDGRHALRCDVCSATFSPLRHAGVDSGRLRHPCHVCCAGELWPSDPRAVGAGGEQLAF